MYYLTARHEKQGWGAVIGSDQAVMSDVREDAAHQSRKIIFSYWL